MPVFPVEIPQILALVVEKGQKRRLQDMAGPAKSTGSDFERFIDLSDGSKVLLIKNGFSILSHLSYSPFCKDGVRFRSVAHFIAAQKALFFRDFYSYHGILEERSTRKLSTYTVAGYDHARWVSVWSDVLLSLIHI